MKYFIQLFVIILLLSCAQEKIEISNKIIKTTTNQITLEPLDLDDNYPVDFNNLDFNFSAVSGKEMVASIKVTPEFNIAIKTTQIGLAEYKLSIRSKEDNPSFIDKEINLIIVSEFLIDFTQSAPFEPTGSIKGVAYPNDSIVKVSKKIIGIDKDNNLLSLSPGLVVNKKFAPFPHNDTINFKDFKEPIKYFGYKENSGPFNFRYQPIIPMLEVGDGKNNRGVGIIVINKNQIMNNPKGYYKFEGYCSIRTRTDDKETYNLGVVIGTINKDKASFKDAIVARDYFNIGYSSSGQIFSDNFNLNEDDYLTINIVGEAGIGRDKNRTTRFEYIKIIPVLEQ